MEERTQHEVDSTGTLPVSGADAVTTVGSDATSRPEPAWLSKAREGIATPGKYLAYEDGDRAIVVAVSREWTRIGRSLAADVRFDDATVSRRHALIVSQADGVRVLDDRSLNGVYVNGRRVEWSPIKDGDEIVVGRHSLFFVDTATVGSPTEPAVAAAE